MRDWKNYYLVKSNQWNDLLYSFSFIFKKPFWKFSLANLLFCLVSFFLNPYRQSKNFLLKRGEKNLHQYGETPISAWEKIFSHLSINIDDHLIELGSGRAKGLFWVASKYGCQITAIEQIPGFVTIGKLVAKLVGEKRIDFVQGNFLKHPLDGATHIYLNGVCLSDEAILKLSDKLGREVAKGSYVVSVSYSICDYAKEDFVLVESFPVSFSWGDAEVFVQKKN